MRKFLLCRYEQRCLGSHCRRVSFPLFSTTPRVQSPGSGRISSPSTTRSGTRKGAFDWFIGGRGDAITPGPPPPPLTAAVLKQRTAAIKIEPKVFFANERTFLAWVHSSILLGGASIFITSGKGGLRSQLYGIILLPIAIAFLSYAMFQCENKATRQSG